MRTQAYVLNFLSIIVNLSALSWFGLGHPVACVWVGMVSINCFAFGLLVGSQTSS